MRTVRDNGEITTMFNKRSDMVVHEEAPYNAEPTPAALAASFVTPTDTFYSRNHGPIPDLDPDAWRLRVDGLVEQPLTLTLADLQTRFETVTVAATMQCAGNRRAGLIAVHDIPGEDPWGPTATSTATWTGARLSDVLADATPAAAAQHICFEAPDVSQIATPPAPYGGSIPIAKASAPEVLLVWAMNGEPLEAVHGAPLRVLVPGYIGARSVKWLQRITASTEPSQNYFQATAYRLLPAEADPTTAGPGDGLSLGAVALNSAVLTPADGASVPAGPVPVSGYAFAGGDRAVARVDVSVDGGSTWIQADLGQDRGGWVWRMWHATVEVPTGDVEIIARAWDTSAASQPEDPAPLWNPKGYVNNSWPRITVRAIASDGITRR
ncbi:sulfite oxidase [uncultured Jatrophihabitans sp.]|uniref:sulfite oxidase n=1 Tax=uncultured Jatrophihabitans sp. TaxID=1610747 RepID=UPI0035CA5F1A